MAVKFNDIAIALNMTLDQFFAAAAHANLHYEKTKDEIEENPINPDLILDEKAVKDFNKNYQQTAQRIEKNPIEGNVTFKADFKKVTQGYEKARKKVEKPLTAKVDIKQALQQITALGAAYVGLSQSFGSFRELQTGFANVESLGVKNIDALRTTVLQIGAETPVALNDLTTGLYDVVSAGVDAQNQVSVLESSAKAAKAGLSQTNEALNLGAAVIKGYGLSFNQFEKIMDRAFTTVKLGQTTFADLAKEVQTVVPGFASLKFESSELFGAFATLTGVTGNTSKVATQLDAITRALLAPTNELTAAVQKQGFASVETFAAQQGLAGVLDLVKEETKGSAATVRKLFADSEALKGILALTGAQYDTFAEKTRAVRTETGAASEAFDIQAKTLDSQLQVLENRFNIVTNATLNGFLPAITGVVDLAASLVEAFADLDSSTKKILLGIGLATAAFFKGRAAVLAMRAAVLTLNASLGPAGWLILGISAAATALTLYTDEMRQADSASKKLALTNNELAESFRNVVKSGNQDAGLQKLQQQQELYTSKLEESRAALKRLEDQQKASSKPGRFDNLIDEQKQLVNGYEIALVEIQSLLTKRQDFEKKVRGELTTEELKALDARKKFEFDTNRITLSQYISYLKGRQDALKISLGAESKEYFAFVDNLAKLQADLAQQSRETKLLDVRDNLESEIDFISQKFDEYLGEVKEITFSFNTESFETLQLEYSNQVLLLENNLSILEKLHGQGSDAYKEELKKRELIDLNYYGAKKKLEQTGLEATLSLGDQLITAFQGNSATLFGVGKALAFANATINTIEAVSRAFKDYPWPFNLGVATIQGALGLAQVRKITSTQFKPPAKGKAKGGKITGTDFLNAALPLPPGEDGYAAVRLNEFVVNETSTRLFRPVLEAINNYGNAPRSSAPYAYQAGGVVNNVVSPTPPPQAGNTDLENIAEIIEDGILKGFSRSTLRITADLRARGKEIQAAIDEDKKLDVQL